MNELSEQVLIGSLLGDGGIYKYNNASYPIYKEGHSIKQKNYLLWKKEYLPFETSIKYIEKTIFSYPKLKKSYLCNSTIFLVSKQKEILLNYYYMFYNKGRKHIHLEILNKLDVLGLLVWILDDGSYHYRTKTIRLSTDSFSFNEHLLIKNHLNNKYGFDIRIYQKESRYNIYFTAKDVIKLMDLFQPHISKLPQNILYKLGFDTNRLMEGKKTLKGYFKKYYSKNRWYNSKKFKHRYKTDLEFRKLLRQRCKNYYNQNRDKLLQKHKEVYQRNKYNNISYNIYNPKYQLHNIIISPPI